MEHPELKPLDKADGYNRTDPRTRQAGFYPGFAAGRAIAPIEEIGATQSYADLNNGDTATFELFTTALLEKNTILVSNEMALYHGSISTATRFPAGASLTLANWQIIGPFNSIYSSAAATLPNTLLESGQNSYQLGIRNIAAGAAQRIYFLARTKYIINYGGTA